MKCFHNNTLRAAALLSFLGACSTQTLTTTAPLAPISKLDVQRYLGRWYEIAKYPNWFQRKCIGNTSAVYALNPDSTIAVTNQCKLAGGQFDTAQGLGRQIGDTQSPKLEVRFAPSWLSFVPLVWGNYWVIDIDAAYSLAAVSEPQRDYLWILSRTPQVETTAYQNLLQRLNEKGFDIQKLELTPQD